jgi:hypothetical protein
LQKAEVASAATQPKEIPKGLPCDIQDGTTVTQAERDATRGSRMIHGDVLRVDGATYVITDENGKEVRVHTDKTTEKPPINTGDQISATVDDQHHALWVRANKATDRRTEHASSDCNPSDNLPISLRRVLKSKSGIKEITRWKVRKQWE